MSKNIIGDSLAVTINFKWLLQLLAFVSTITYVFYTFQMKLDNMSRQIGDNMVELHELIEIHEEESEVQIAEMQATIKWYQGQLNINPLSWGKKKK
jgi:predicted amino acid-binding ACT domain protein